ncbi:MAG: MerR family transcriptional regulator [Lentisphaeria bacterium]|nr:MerR family transcriptional regulator [Lentisphaeria bacterium]
MESKQSYSVSELAAILNLPRTTINDWLSKYARFLDTELKGKRKVYSANSLAVLKDIANFRNNGIQLPDIDKLLEDKYGIHGEIQDENLTDKSDENKQNDGASSSSELPAQTVNSEEMTILVKNQFEELLLRMEEVNKSRNSAIRRANAFLAMLFILLFVLLGAGGFLGLKMFAISVQSDNAAQKAELKRDYTAMQKNLTDKFIENNRQISDLSEKTSADLENIVSNLNNKNDELKKELDAQRLELKKLLEELKAENKNLEAEAIKKREEYAAKQLEILENMRKNQAELEKIKNELTESRKSEAALREKLEEMKSATAQEKQTSSETTEVNSDAKEVAP